jgi:ketosteroid isomerase-like protein
MTSADGRDRARLEANVAVAKAVFQLLRERRFEEALALLSDDGTRWGAGGGPPYEEEPMTTWKAKLRLVEEGVHDTPMDFEIVNVVAAGDQVVLEARNDGTLPDGGPYGMVYCFVLRIEDGMVVSMREYADTAYARARRPELFRSDSPIYKAMAAQGLAHSTFKGLAGGPISE